MTTGNLNVIGDWTAQLPGPAPGLSWGYALALERLVLRPDGKRWRDPFAARLEIRPGHRYKEVGQPDTYRCELYSIPSIPRVGQPYLPVYLERGMVRYFGWSEYIETSFPPATGTAFTILAQWQVAQGGTPPLLLVNQQEGGVDALCLRNNHSNHTYWSKPMSDFRGKTTDFVVGILFDPDPAVAWVRLWVNGAEQQVAASSTKGFTMIPDSQGRLRSYPKVGIYGTDDGVPKFVRVNGYRVSEWFEVADPRGVHP